MLFIKSWYNLLFYISGMSLSMQIKCIQMRPELPEDKKFFCHAQRPLRGPNS